MVDVIIGLIGVVEEFIKKISPFVLHVGLVAILFTTIYLCYDRNFYQKEVENIKRDAVLHGVATYTVNVNGVASFVWVK